MFRFSQFQFKCRQWQRVCSQTEITTLLGCLHPQLLITQQTEYRSIAVIAVDSTQPWLAVIIVIARLSQVSRR